MSSTPVGRWSDHGRLIEVTHRDGGLVVAFPDLPEEFAPRLDLVAAGPDGSGERLVMSGGPYHGLDVDTIERDGVPHLRIGRAVIMPPWREPDVEAVVRGLPGPPVRPKREEARRYQALLDTVHAAGGGVVEPPADVPLGPWVGWLTGQNTVLFHGSSDGGIDTLRPRRVSFEVDDQAQRGNRAAVYATDDGWWAMWFAVIDRDRLRGSMRSGVENFVGPHPRRERLRFYHFSVDYRVLPTRPFGDGWLYLVPRDTFDQLPVLPGGPPSHEWCSQQPVAPLARLPVRATDFPFHDRVSGHDDGELYRLSELGELVRQRVTGGSPSPGGVVLRLRWDQTLATVSEEYLELAGRFTPEITRSFDRDADGAVLLRIQAPGPLALMLHHQCADLFD